MRWLRSIALTLLFIPGSYSFAQDFRVIVNSQNPATSLERKFLADVFLKKITRWPDGSVIQPIDLRSDSSTREYFSESVLNRSVPAIKSHWQQMIFSGRDVPPPELSDDKEIIQYVSKHPASIGYVSRNTDPAGTKEISVK